MGIRRENLLSRKRILVYISITFLFSTFISVFFKIPESENKNYIIMSCITLSIILLVGIVIVFRNRIYFAKHSNLGFIPIALIVMLTIAAGIAYPVIYSGINYTKLSDFENSIALVYGRVCNEPAESRTGKSIKIELKTSYIESETHILDKPNSKIVVYLKKNAETDNIKYGDGLSFVSELKRPVEELDNVKNFNYRNNLLSNGFYLTSYSEECSLYTPQDSLVDKLLFSFYMIRCEAKQYVEQTILSSDDNRALLSGIMFGIKDDFSDGLYDDMSKSGFMHIASVSGLHVAYLCMFLSFLLKYLNLRVRSIITIFILILFAGISAFTPSVNRAVIMTMFVMLANIFYKNADSLTSLFGAALILVLVNPYVLFNAGMILSFLGTFALLTIINPFKDLVVITVNTLTNKICHFLERFKLFSKKDNIDKAKKYLWRIIFAFLFSFITPLACQIITLPFLAYYFNFVTFGSILGNIIIIPCTSIAFIGGIVNFALYCINLPLSRLVAKIVIEPALEGICLVSNHIANSRLNYATEVTPVFLTFVMYYLFCVVIYCFLKFILRKFNSK